jgi:S1-C subfamily serine protease
MMIRALAAALLTALAFPACAQEAKPEAGAGRSLEDLVSSVVQIKTFINPDGRTIENLGRQREGSGIVIDDDGLVLTIGYLMVEAHAAEVITNAGRAVPATIVGYDHESGFGLIKAIEPLKLKPLVFGRSAEVKRSDPVLVASFGGSRMIAPAYVVAKREFAGNWEYLLDEAIFTAPPHPAWSGAALISREGRLIGVGSLIVGDAVGDGDNTAGNMFVPIDRLPPILGDLIADGRPSSVPRPWLGVTTTEMHGRLFVGRVTADSPAEQAGLRRGDVIVGVNGEPASGMADFYRKVWAFGRAGVSVPLDVLQGSEKRRVDVKSMNRLDHLKLKSTF